MTPVAFDLTRLVTRLRHASPSGIDRVDLAYARRFLDGDGPRHGLVSTAFGPKVLGREAARAIVDRVVAGWVEEIAAEDDPVLAALAARLSGGPPPPIRPRPRDASQLGRRRAQAEAAAVIARGAGAAALPDGTLYLHTSHLRLDRPERFDWLYDRPDVRAAFFVHDLIPIEYPEYGRPGEAARHRVRMETVARHADLVVANSTDVGRRYASHVATIGRPPRPVVAAPLGIEPAFSERAGPTLLTARPTFVAVSTIEARKNHILLLNLWRALAERHGSATPHLVIVGRRGWEAENVVDMLDRCEAIRPHVTEVVGLSTAGLVRLLRSATALLMPSFAEGYGLPVVEAAAAGAPVVASDIPVHREVGAGFAHLVDPLDGPGWMAAVGALSDPASDLRGRLAGLSLAHPPPTWPAHFAILDAALAQHGLA